MARKDDRTVKGSSRMVSENVAQLENQEGRMVRVNLTEPFTECVCHCYEYYRTAHLRPSGTVRL